MSISAIGKIYKDIQEIRISLGNKTWASEAGRSEPMPAVFETMIEQLRDMEKQLIKAAMGELKYHPAWPWLKKVKGLGPTLAVQLLGYIGDIGRFDTVSKLWRYSGLACIDGVAERPRKGEPLHYKPSLKSLMYNIGTSFLKSRSPYRKIYDEARARYEQREDWTKMHVHLAAMRKMEKIFLAHLWEVWRREVGLPVRVPYVVEYLGHTTISRPEEFVS